MTHSWKILHVFWRLIFQGPQMYGRKNSKLNVEFVMHKVFQLVMSYRCCLMFIYITSYWPYDAYVDDELGNKSGSGTDYTCDNSNCSRAFHSICLGDWLRSITTTRQYVEFLYGHCFKHDWVLVVICLFLYNRVATLYLIALYFWLNLVTVAHANW